MDKRKGKTLFFWVCLIAAIGLGIGGFFVPPMGVIDGSILKMVGMLFGFAALGELPEIISSAEYARFTKGDTIIEVGDHHEDKVQEN